MNLDRLFEESEQNRQSGRLIEAYQGYAKFLKHRISKEVHNSDDFDNIDAIVIERLADLAQLFRQDAPALDLLQALELLYKDAGNTFAWFYIVLKKTNLLLNLPDTQLAYANLAQNLLPFIGDLSAISITPEGLKIWEKSCINPAKNAEEAAFLWTWLYFVMGRILARMGQYGNAITLFDRGLTHAQNKGYGLSDYWNGMLKVNIAVACLEKGDLDLSSEILNELKAGLGIAPTISPLQIQVIEAEAKLFFLRGELGNSYRIYSKIYERYFKLQLPDALLAALFNLAQIKILLNQVYDAEQLIRVAEDTLPESPQKELLDKINLLKFLAQERKASVGDPWNISVRAAAPNDAQLGSAPNVEIKTIRYAESYLSAFEQRALLYQIYMSCGNEAAAEDMLKGIKTLFANCDSELIGVRINVLQLYHTHFVQLGSMPHDIATQTLKWLSQKKLLTELWQLRRLLVYDGFYINDKETSEAIEENKKLLQQIAGTLSPGDSAVFMLNKWEEGEVAMANSLNKIIRESIKGGLWSFITNLFFSKKAKINGLLADLVFDIDQYKESIVQKEVLRRETNGALPKKGSLIKTHPKEILTIRFLVLADRLVTIFYTRDFIDFKVYFVSRIVLRNLLKELHLSNPFSQTNRDIGFERMATTQQSADHLLEELAEYFCFEDILSDTPRNIKKLRIIPDDVLCGFPFALLKVKNDYLINHFPLTIAYDDDIYTSGQKHKVSKMLLAGVSQSLRGNIPLPGVQREIKEINMVSRFQNLYKETWENEQVKKEKILQGLQHYDMMHIACHGAFNHENPLESGLILEENDTLSLSAVLALGQHIAVKHLTLSSCWAADQFVTPNRWVFSLPQAFKRLGVPSTLACLWQVSDEHAVSFMKTFYEYLNDHPSDVALQLTQQLAIKNQLIKNEKTEDPFIWSGFMLHGEGVCMV